VNHSQRILHGFPITVNRASGSVTVNDTDDDGNNKNAPEKMSLPLDRANGITPTLPQEVAAGTPKILASRVVATPGPRRVKLGITPQGEDSFSVGAMSYKAIQYDLHIDIGGVAGVVAPMVGRQPDSHVWIAQDGVAILVKSEGLLIEGEPMGRIESASPVEPKGGSEESKQGR
jgi:hypothetical protein